MSKESFLRDLRQGLSGLPPAEIDEILADYAAYFDDGAANGRTEDDIAAALGDPRRLARELSVERRLKQWEDHRSPGTLIGAVLALCGLATFDLLFLLPMLVFLGILMLPVLVAMFAALLVGLADLIAAAPFGIFGSFTGLVDHLLRGVGLVSGSIGCGALLLLAISAGMRLLSAYARVHYRLLPPPRTGP
jgi:uncharacterized membrane protein